MQRILEGLLLGYNMMLEHHERDIGVASRMSHHGEFLAALEAVRGDFHASAAIQQRLQPIVYT